MVSAKINTALFNMVFNFHPSISDPTKAFQAQQKAQRKRDEVAAPAAPKAPVDAKRERCEISQWLKECLNDIKIQIVKVEAEI